MTRRKSQWCKGVKARKKFNPSLEEWSEACELFAYNRQVAKFFGITEEAFYLFLDGEHYKEEQDSSYKSEYIEAHMACRKKTKTRVLDNLLKGSDKGEPAMTIFAAKSFGGVMEEKDRLLYSLKRDELQLKRQVYLSDLAAKFNLNFEELKEFTNNYVRYKVGTGEDPEEK